MRIPRWLHHLYADFAGYFWMPCPKCAEYFGGHEWRAPYATVPVWIRGEPHQMGVCPDCAKTLTP